MPTTLKQNNPSPLLARYAVSKFAPIDGLMRFRIFQQAVPLIKRSMNYHPQGLSPRGGGHMIQPVCINHRPLILHRSVLILHPVCYAAGGELVR